MFYFPKWEHCPASEIYVETKKMKREVTAMDKEVAVLSAYACP
jgi:hypothetical protein